LDILSAVVTLFLIMDPLGEPQRRTTRAGEMIESGCLGRSLRCTTGFGDGPGTRTNYPSQHDARKKFGTSLCGLVRHRVI
jgi:hypothetical protein